ncbi:NifB/NifX family molybdenum-iron cluster-binding protein [Pantanalinema rosaneae CENA516]|uniref:NifB/NifX family molybdenum-iron cluster-binding protein n=1 Tax=Pantanalinema rosaneae TaxID=1620701 RepID=UPI003D6E1318
MKIAVSSHNQTDITGHAGHCLQFWVYELDLPEVQTKQLLQLTKDQSFHATSATDPHPLDDVQVLISGSMGSGLARRLASKGIQPIVTPETDPDAAVAAYLVGSLVTGMPEEHGHTHTHDADHDQAEPCGCSG